MFRREGTLLMIAHEGGVADCAQGQEKQFAVCISCAMGRYVCRFGYVCRFDALGKQCTGGSIPVVR